ncbi:MAG: HD domain-containing protein [Oscillospiraceae bacterium]|nr:HD domain-containing protein [Oscillospiraceae bacterium]
MEKINQLMLAMTDYFAGDARRIQHFTKVWAYARLIAMEEHVDGETRFLLEAAALTHDIGIRDAEAQFGYNNGKLQEQFGPAPAQALLQRLGFDAELTDRVCFLIAHHHTYQSIEGIDYQILIEADFLVNLFESQSAPNDTVRALFTTATGKRLLETMYKKEIDHASGH